MADDIVISEKGNGEKEHDDLVAALGENVDDLVKRLSQNTLDGPVITLLDAPSVEPVPMPPVLAVEKNLVVPSVPVVVTERVSVKEIVRNFEVLTAVEVTKKEETPVVKKEEEPVVIVAHVELPIAKKEEETKKEEPKKEAETKKEEPPVAAIEPVNGTTKEEPPLKNEETGSTYRSETVNALDDALLKRLEALKEPPLQVVVTATQSVCTATATPTTPPTEMARPPNIVTSLLEQPMTPIPEGSTLSGAAAPASAPAMSNPTAVPPPIVPQATSLTPPPPAPPAPSPPITPTNADVLALAKGLSGMTVVWEATLLHMKTCHAKEQYLAYIRENLSKLRAAFENPSAPPPSDLQPISRWVPVCSNCQKISALSLSSRNKRRRPAPSPTGPALSSTFVEAQQQQKRAAAQEKTASGGIISTIKTFFNLG